MEQGDVIVTGTNFGTSSSRAAAGILVEVGVGAIVCESCAPIFYRNTWNIGLPVLQCEKVRGKFSKGDPIEVNVINGTLKNLRTAEELQAEAPPEILLEIFQQGGNEGYN